MPDATVVPIRPMGSIMNDLYTTKELIEAINAVKDEVHHLRVDHLNLFTALGARLQGVEDVVGDKDTGLVATANKHTEEIADLSKIWFRYLPMILTALTIIISVLIFVFRG